MSVFFKTKVIQSFRNLCLFSDRIVFFIQSDLFRREGSKYGPNINIPKNTKELRSLKYCDAIGN